MGNQALGCPKIDYPFFISIQGIEIAVAGNPFGDIIHLYSKMLGVDSADTQAVTDPDTMIIAGYKPIAIIRLKSIIGSEIHYCVGSKQIYSFTIC